MRGNKMRYSVLICIVASLLAFLLVLLPANIQATVDHDTSVAIPDTTSESGTWPVVNSVTPGFNKPIVKARSLIKVRRTITLPQAIPLIRMVRRFM